MKSANCHRLPLYSLLALAVALPILAASTTASADNMAICPRASLVSHWHRLFPTATDIPAFLLSRSSPLTATELATFSSYIDANSLHTPAHLSAFCSAANVLCSINLPHGGFEDDINKGNHDFHWGTSFANKGNRDFHWGSGNRDFHWGSSFADKGNRDFHLGSANRDFHWGSSFADMGNRDFHWGSSFAEKGNRDFHWGSSFAEKGNRDFHWGSSFVTEGNRNRGLDFYKAMIKFLSADFEDDVTKGDGNLGSVFITKGNRKLGPSFLRLPMTSLEDDIAFVKQYIHKMVIPGLYFREANITTGQKIHIPDIRDKMPKTSFLPKSISDKLPFSSKSLAGLVELLEVSSMQQAMSETITACEIPPIDGERKACVRSIEDMGDFVAAEVGPKVEALFTETAKGWGQEAVVGKVVAMNGGKETATVGCHQSMFPYLIYFCHRLPGVKVYHVELLLGDSAEEKNHAVAICHMDTSKFNPNHLAFLVLGRGPGKIEVCHFMSEGGITWAALD